MGSQAAKDAAKKRKREAQSSLTLLDSEGLEIFRLSAKECGLTHYSQRAADGSRRHFRAAPHEVPRPENAPIAENVADPFWYLIPAKQIQRIDPAVMDNLYRGVTIGKDYQAVERSAP